MVRDGLRPPHHEVSISVLEQFLMSATYDVLAIGNAIFDILVQTDEAFLQKQGMSKGSMQLIDEARAASIYAAMGPATEISGGAAANTAVGVAYFGRAPR